jgi:hypothetical protein
LKNSIVWSSISLLNRQVIQASCQGLRGRSGGLKARAQLAWGNAPGSRQGGFGGLKARVKAPQRAPVLFCIYTLETHLLSATPCIYRTANHLLSMNRWCSHREVNPRESGSAYSPLSRIFSFVYTHLQVLYHQPIFVYTEPQAICYERIDGICRGRLLTSFCRTRVQLRNRTPDRER